MPPMDFCASVAVTSRPAICMRFFNTSKGCTMTVATVLQKKKKNVSRRVKAVRGANVCVCILTRPFRRWRISRKTVSLRNRSLCGLFIFFFLLSKNFGIIKFFSAAAGRGVELVERSGPRTTIIIRFTAVVVLLLCPSVGRRRIYYYYY